MAGPVLMDKSKAKRVRADFKDSSGKVASNILTHAMIRFMSEERGRKKIDECYERALSEGVGTAIETVQDYIQHTRRISEFYGIF